MKNYDFFRQIGWKNYKGKWDKTEIIVDSIVLLVVGVVIVSVTFIWL